MNSDYAVNFASGPGNWSGSVNVVIDHVICVLKPDDTYVQCSAY